ncbi:MAG TPA: isoleucine--tRNA ligase [Actinomycetota bacterium]|nr:isoleucine--tRNA ligase [Actinomycetota bacterium]
MGAFEPVPATVSFPDLERGILDWWGEAGIFERSVAQREGAPPWIFYEGPPTANGRPGIHHVEARTFKDVYPRFKTMTGHQVRRKGGWDCHGLPVEIEVEKEIGTTSKRDIETFGVAEFNRLCRASVQRYVGEWERVTDRIGYWIDMSDPYRTMDTGYIESVWWSLRRLFERGLLVEDHKVTAYCPRCGTPLSDAEVALGYRSVEDPSVVVRFPVVEAADASLVGTSLLVWTTTPWTLPSNTGAAVAGDADYEVRERDGDRVLVAAALAGTVLDDGWATAATVRGADLAGLRYEPPYPNVQGAHTVVVTDFVSLADGTGVVHLAPAFGAPDLEVGRRHGWELWRPVGEDGRFTEDAPAFVRDTFVKDADPAIVEDLRSRGRLFADATIEHAYPFCWRCQTPLLYYARSSWFVRTTAVRDRLLEVNDGVNWVPEHIRHGRYGDWLENNVDWALSRDRYWGTPLPIWRCEEGHLTAIGSLDELGRLAGRDVGDIDPHRPAIDDVTFPCPTCDGVATRVPQVIDTWYDSGAMPFAQWGYHPDLGRGVEAFEASFPADFIAEAIDQTRGWFYTLMAEGVLHFDETAYRNVVCLGHLVAEDGRKMSKSLGNIFDPWEALDRQGADALRWWMITNGSPWESRRIGHEVLDENVRQLLLPLWNVYGFFVTYANASGWTPGAGGTPTVLDRWIRSRLAGTVREARDRLDAYDATTAGRAIAGLLEDLSVWYVRRSRRRFWNPGGEGGADADAAFATLHRCLITIAQLLAPFTPFIAEVLWRNLAAGREGAPDSVHLSDYPAVHEADVDPGLEAAMAAAREVVELGRRVRAETTTKVRQPLAEAVVHVATAPAGLEELWPVVAEELNVREVRSAEAADSLGRWRVRPDFKVLGRRLGGRVQALAATLEADDGTVAGLLAAGDHVDVAVDDGPPVRLAPEDVALTRLTREGWGMASDGGVTVALELTLTPELRAEGAARDLVRVIQDARKAAGLAVTDRIELGVLAGGAVGDALEAHRAMIGGETLATRILRADVDDALHRSTATVDGEAVTVTLRRADAAG